MSKELKLDVNQFPSLTWNHLNINRTSFDFNAGPYSIFTGDCPLLAPVSFSSEYEKIETGMGRAFDEELDQLHSAEKEVNFFEIKESSFFEKPFLVTVDASSLSSSLYDTVIQAGKNSVSSFIFLYKGNSEKACDIGNRIRIFADENASVKISLVNLTGLNVNFFNSLGCLAKDNSKITYVALELGKGKAWFSFKNLLAGYKSSFKGNIAYCATGDRFLDMNHVVIHRGKESESEYSVDGVLGGKAKKTWRGTIDFKKGCSASKGNEQEDVLLLDPSIVNKSLPVILCDEEDVEGRHGCTVGRIDEEKLFYLQTRGVDEKEAKELLIKGKVLAVAKLTDNDEIFKMVENFVEGVDYE